MFLNHPVILHWSQQWETKPQLYLFQVSFLWFVGDHVLADCSRSSIPVEPHGAVSNVSDCQDPSRRRGHWGRTGNGHPFKFEQRRLDNESIYKPSITIHISVKTLKDADGHDGAKTYGIAEKQTAARFLSDAALDICFFSASVFFLKVPNPKYKLQHVGELLTWQWNSTKFCWSSYLYKTLLNIKISFKGQKFWYIMHMTLFPKITNVVDSICTADLI